MTDVVDKATRSRMMSGIRGKNTKPEILVRKALHRLGFRYRLHPKNVFGKPDFVLRRYSAAVFVHGCFWHGHACSLFKLPATRREFWRTKIKRNKARDREIVDELKHRGWRHITVWECAFRGPGQIGAEETVRRVAAWIVSSRRTGEIRGRM